MASGTLLVFQEEKLLPDYKAQFESLGYTNVHVTNKKFDALHRVINEVNPRRIFIDSNFYSGGTPYMVGQLIDKFPDKTFNVLSMNHFSDRLAVWFIFHGVKSYLKYSDGKEEFAQGLKRIRAGETVIAPDVQSLIDGIEWPEVKKKADKRQLEVLVLLCNGNLPDVIAEKLNISRRTVDWHIEELFKVFHACCREELIAMAFYLDIVTKDDLCFFDRKMKQVTLPQWAVVQQKMAS